MQTNRGGTRALALAVVSCVALGTGGCGGRKGSDGGAGVPCGALTCAADEWCDFDGNDCAKSVGGGDPACVTRPATCAPDDLPVCGCDGIVYPNQCEATRAGTDVSEGGGCAAPAGTYACGLRFCADGTTYCQEQESDTPETYFTCVDLPAGCGAAPDCACLAAETCPSGSSDSGVPASGTCATMPDGHLDLACPCPIPGCN
ncbi:MAG TPA: hypothetical protein VG389_06490 [Myxococcota bacterium]|nr:hypothetical protein [Myxococcota bacterium]